MLGNHHPCLVPELLRHLQRKPRPHEQATEFLSGLELGSVWLSEPGAEGDFSGNRIFRCEVSLGTVGHNPFVCELRDLEGERGIGLAF